MRSINHALAGAFIGLEISNPVVAVPVAFVSHYICDVIPHYGGGKPEREEINSNSFQVLLILDVCLCALLVLVLALYHPRHWILAAICAFVAASPDLFSINRYRSAKAGKPIRHNRYIRFSTGIQWFERPIGAVVEVAWFIALVIILVPIIRQR